MVNFIDDSSSEACFEINGATEDGVEHFKYLFSCDKFEIKLSYDDREVLRVNPITSL